MPKMETLANWEDEWTTGHPHHGDTSLPTTMTAGPTWSCCFDAAEEEVFEPAQLISSQVPTHPVDQLLLDGLVGGPAASDWDLKGQTFDYWFIATPTSLDCYRPETSPPASGDSRSSLSTHQAFWSVPAGSSCESGFEHNNLDPQIHTHDSFKKRKRRDWNLRPDPDPKKHFTLFGSGSGLEYNYPNSGLFKLIRESKSSTLSFQQGVAVGSGREEEGDLDVDAEAIQQMKEMMYRAAAFRPVNFGAEVVEKPRRKNVRISSDPQTVAARQRRERISERLRVLQKLVPGGCKMDTASMLDEAANYLKFLRSQVKALEAIPPPASSTAAAPTSITSISSSPSPNSHFSANQMMPSTFGSFNLSNCLPNNNNNNNNDVGGRLISMISNQPIPIPAMHLNLASNPPLLLQQYAKS